MARTHYVKKSQKAQGSCMSPSCSHSERTIGVGESYKWFSIRSNRASAGTRKVYHTDCVVPQSHTTTSAYLGAIYDAQENASSQIEALGPDNEASDLETIAQEAADAIREVGEQYGEAADNIEDGFGHSTFQADELREKADGCESWASDIESVDLDEFDPSDAGLDDEPPAEDEFDGDEDEFQSALTEYEEALSNARDDWWSEQTGKVNDALNEMPF